MPSYLEFADTDWERIRRDWMAWWEGELERPMVVMLDDAPPDEDDRTPRKKFGTIVSSFFGMPLSFPLDTPAQTVLDHYEPYLESMCYRVDAWPAWWPNFGPGIVGGFLGAEVHFSEETNTAWFAPAKKLSIEDVHPIYDACNAYWQRVLGLTRAAVERWGEKVTVGFSDLGGNLDILASLCSTEELFLAMVEAPEEVERLAGDVTRLWLRYYDELHEVTERTGRGVSDWASLWAPCRYYMLQSDLSYNISPQMFERFVLPDLAACCESLDYGFYHLDGRGQIAHLDLLLSLDRLRGIQWIPGAGQPPPEDWLPLLKRIRDGGKLCQVYVKPEGAIKIVRELGGRGFAFGVGAQMSDEEAQRFMDVLIAEDGERC